VISEPYDRAWQLVSGFRFTQMVRAVTELRIPDLIAAGPRTADELADSSSTKAGPLRRVLRCLAAMGVFVEMDDGRFGPTPVSECFRDVPGSLRGNALMLPTESYVAFGDIMHTLKTGGPAFEHVFGMSRWEQLSQEPEKAVLFNAAMQSGTEHVRDLVAAAYDFASVRTVVDVGGGRGTLIAGVLKAHPHLHGTVFDLDAGVAEADAYLKQQGVRDRCDVAIGSFFETIPEGHDIYVLKSVIHDWSDEKAAMILATCRKAMGASSRLVLVEQIVPGKAEQTPESRRVFMDDVQMLVMLNGLERTEDQFRALLLGAGLVLSRSIPTGTRFHLIEAVPEG
jgi:hypothetical protein